MTELKILNCPGTLAEGYDTYSPVALKRMFDSKKVSHILEYNSPKTSDEDAAIFNENRERISISGVQNKYSMVLEKKHLRLTNEGERGRYILKPITSDIKNSLNLPANEHLTMQIARQIFDIPTAENALMFFKEGEPAYITKRFDYNESGEKIKQEDFASLTGRTKDTDGPDYKYNGSYEELGETLKKYVAASTPELEKLLDLIIFNYIFSNGDAHLKNFSLTQTADKDHILTPAYDLLNTSLHIKDNDFALKHGLLNGEVKEKNDPHPNSEKFRELGKRFGLAESRVSKIIEKYSDRNEKVYKLIENSFLDERNKRDYKYSYERKVKYFNRIL